MAWSSMHLGVGRQCEKGREIEEKYILTVGGFVEHFLPSILPIF
jgi:hypothetical protein